MSYTCFVCGKSLPNKWSIARCETAADGVMRCYCHLHADEGFVKRPTKATMKETEQTMINCNDAETSRANEIVHAASGEQTKKAWSECSALATRLGGGIKALWSKIHPDRSPEAMLLVLDEDLAVNAKRLSVIKPALEEAYNKIMAKKREYQGAIAARQRLLKVELQTLLSRYKSLEREFNILCENERSIETVRGRFLEVLAYGMRGKLNTGLVDRLADNVDNKAEDAEDVQDALGDLERAGRRRDRDIDNFDAELAQFDGTLGISGKAEDDLTQNKEANNEQIEDGAGGDVRLGDFA